MTKRNPDEHLPECGVTRYPICICDRLRACEKRVTKRWEGLHGWGETYAFKNGKDAAWESALYAAREAVEALPAEPSWPVGIPRFDKPGVLAAIDALKEKP